MASASLPSISLVHGRYLVYDINVASTLRSVWQICGALFGTLPQAQQQNIFLGLPLELMEEEAVYLVEKGAATIIDDTQEHCSATIRRAQDLNASNLAQMTSTGMAGVANATKPRPEDSHPSSKEDGLKSSVKPRHVAPLQYSIPMATLKDGEISLKRLLTETPVLATPRYMIYKFLRSSGYYLSPGLRFGCQFLAYPGDPLRYHSHFLVRSYSWEEEIPVLDLVGGGRLGTGVKKAWMIGGVENGAPHCAEDSDTRVFCLEWGGFG